VAPGRVLLTPSPETTVILPDNEALETPEFVPWSGRATAGSASKGNAIEIVQQAASKILWTIFIVLRSISDVG
jgi:hypothetical protein